MAHNPRIIALGDTIKATQEGPRLRAGGYLVRFTDEGRRDLHGQYFSKSTNYYMDAYPVEGRPVLYNHGLDPEIGVIPIGYIDTVEVTDEGIYASYQLDFASIYKAHVKALNAPDSWKAEQEALADEYEAYIAELIRDGKLGWSSGALPQSVQADEKGLITEWAIIEGSNTPTPAMPMDTAIMDAKSLPNIPLRSLRKTNVTEPGIGADAQQGVKAQGPDTATPQTTDKTGDGNMSVKMSTRGELREMVQRTFRSMEEELVAAIGDMLGMDAEEAKEMVGEMEDDVARMAEEDETMMAMYGEEDKADDALVARSVAVRLPRWALTAARKRFEIRTQTRKSVSDALREGLRDMTPGKSQVRSIAQQENPEMKSAPRIDRVTDMRYDHLSASDMALAAEVMMSEARKSGLRVNLGQVASPEFIRALYTKAHGHLEGKPYRHSHEVSGMKAAIGIKANELDASDLTGQGAEWVGEFWSNELWLKERPELVFDRVVAKGMMVREVPQGSQTAHFPTEGSDPIAYNRPQANNLDATGNPEVTATVNFFGTGQVEVTPGEISLASGWTDILAEDSVINVVQTANEQLMKAALEYRDRLLINGDTATAANTNINLIDGTPATGNLRPYYLASNGFRKLPLVTATSQSRDAGNALSEVDYRATIGLLDGELRARRNNMVFLIDYDTETASLAIPSIATLDVAGSVATIQSGVITGIYGVDVITAGLLPQTNTAGKVSATGSNNVRGTILLVYAPYWGFAYKRRVAFETIRYGLSGTTVLLGTMRAGVVARGNNAAALTYNVAV